MFFEISNRTLLLAAAAVLCAAPPAGAQALVPARQAPSPAAIARAVADDLKAGRFADVAARFDATMAAALPEAKLAEVWSGLVAQVGATKSFGAPRETAAGGMTVVAIPIAFEKAALDLRVVVNAEGKLAGLRLVPAEAAPASAWTPPAYADPKAFREVEVTVGKAPWALPGTLTLPVTPARVPAVVLVQGSGPHDRNEEIGPNRPFQDLAWGLASRGVAVLRYEKRTKAHGDAMAALKDLTVREEVTDDARAAVALLRARAEVDPRRVFLLGHSLGGTLAPRIAKETTKEEPALAGLVILAGATRPLPDLFVEQTEYIASLSPKDAATEKKVAEVKAEAERARRAKAGDPPALFAPASYWLDLNAYDPAATLAALKTPALVLQGLRDYQVTEKDLEGWRRAAAARGGIAIAPFADLNHLFMTGAGKATPAEYERAGHVDERVVARVAAFVNGGPGAR